MTEKRFSVVINSNNHKSISDRDRTEDEPLIALIVSDVHREIWGIDECCELLNQQSKRIEELEIINNGLNYALKYIKKIDVEIDLDD